MKFDENANTPAYLFMGASPLLRVADGYDGEAVVWPRKLNSYVWPRPHGRREANPNYAGHSAWKREVIKYPLLTVQDGISRAMKFCMSLVLKWIVSITSPL